MQSLLLSRITKDFLNQDPDIVPSKARYRMGWAGSVLASHPKAPSTPLKAAALLSTLKEKFNQWLATESALIPLSSPQLSSPLPPPQATFQPAWYFSRGALENDRRKNPQPIWYLLTEANEKAKPRPVPGSFMLLRSICKGKGVLRQNKQGLIFLDVDNRFISALLPFLKGHGLVRPPYFNLFAIPDGAHVPVIPAREIAFQYLDHITEIGKTFSFEIEGLYSLQPSSWPEVEQVWFFKIHSPELEDLRRRYFLSALPGGHPFHIAVAVKPHLSISEIPRPLPLMRINMAFLAA